MTSERKFSKQENQIEEVLISHLCGLTCKFPPLQAVIIGLETKTLLHMEVKNKFCSTCSQAKSRGSPAAHKCYLNYKGASTVMESQAILDRFSQCVDKYGLLYRYYIGDGDSTIHTQLVESGQRYYKLAKDTRIPLESRRLLTEQHVTTSEGVRTPCFTKIERFVKGIRIAIKECSKIGSVEQVRQDIRNALYHIFGRHTQTAEGETDHTDDAEKSGLLAEIFKAIDPLVKNAHRLKFNYTTNQAERYMALVSNYRRQCLAAARSHLKGPAWHFSPWKKLTGHSPVNIFKLQLDKWEKKRPKRALKYANEEPPQRNKRKLTLHNQT
ncbi:hypothetical protein PR048_012743 [Dryococelus australis]|uniref:Mutator-like transposase domain-containing protein n=1 Tax=Dryococelus australis TaxID=614101 RepID=A0ABQ9HQ73_9NEOP|nr:hypothetical protein PR048_012743 [Dryococelus australis]